MNIRDDYRRGKQERKQTQSFSFLQSEFKSLSDEDRDEFLHHAWHKYKISGKTNLLERYTIKLINCVDGVKALDKANNNRL